MVEAKQQIVSERVTPVQLKPFLIKGKMTLPCSDGEKPVVYNTSSICATQRIVEQAGRGYIELCKRALKREQNGALHDEEEDEESKNEKEEDGAGEKKKEEYEQKRHKKTKEQIEREAMEGDLYGLLELDEKNEATVDQIRKAYRKATLKYHPDKLVTKGEEPTEAQKETWLKVQEAMETLTDPKKRQKYDSSLPFDDSTPEESEWKNTAEYMEVFAKVFKRNNMWSKKKPVPDFLMSSMDIEALKKFFRFWDNFDSWRCFSQYDEYDTSEAQDRYERRYMEKENKKGQ
jgi:DnaJ family protein C protein 2